MATIITAFDLTPNDCKVVQLSRQKTFMVRRALLVPFHGIVEEGEKAVSAKAHILREALRANKLQPINAVLVVPKHSATVRSVFLPSVNPAELEGMAHFEAEKIIPFNVERHVISHAVMSQESIGGSRVLLAAVDEPIIAESLHVLTQAGVEPTVSQVSSIALVDAWRRENAEPGEAITALVNIASAHTDITLLKKGVLLTTRSVLLGVDALLRDLTEATHSARALSILDLLSLDAREPGAFTASPVAATSASIAGIPAAGKVAASPSGGTSPSAEAASDATGDAAGAATTDALPTDAPTPRPATPEPFQILRDPETSDPTTGPAAEVVRQWVGRLLSEIRKTYDFARREFEIGGMEFVRLSGEGSLIRGLEQNLTVTLGAEVSVFSPLAEIPKAPKQPEIDPRLLPVFAIATGGALHGLWPESYPINLLPAELVERQERQTRRLALLLLGAMALIAITISYIYISSLYNWREDRLRYFDQYNSQMEKQVKDLKDKKLKIVILEKYQRDRASSLAILDAISAYPKIGPTTKNGRITLTSFNYASGDEVKIEGDAMDIPDVFEFVSYLEKFEIDGQRVFRTVQVQQHSSKNLPGRPTVYFYRLICFLKEEGSKRSRI